MCIPLHHRPVVVTDGPPSAKVGKKSGDIDEDEQNVWRAVATAGEPAHHDSFPFRGRSACPNLGLFFRFSTGDISVID